jgi:tRNA (guanine-N7-)-methyltransferase
LRPAESGDTHLAPDAVAVGRRALPKIDPSVSIDGHYCELADLVQPLDVASWFSRRGPLEIEIGSGKGLFLLNESARSPERLFIGVEAAIKYARFAAYRLARARRDNVRIVRGDAMQFLREFVADRSVEAIHVYFPDPWWKERHRRRRVMQESTIADIARVLRPGGVLHFWSDVEEYFEATCTLIAAFPAFGKPQPVPPEPAGHDMDYRTHFERRMRLHGHPVFRARFVVGA